MHLSGGGGAKTQGTRIPIGFLKKILYVVFGLKSAIQATGFRVCKSNLVFSFWS
jgi:hypothetical protein